MGRRTKWLEALLGTSDADRQAVIAILQRRYVREKQQAMRYRQHAERMRYPQFRATLIRLAEEEEKHAEKIADKLSALGAGLPDVVPVHVAHESNSWHYLKTDLDEEQRCAGELHEGLSGAPEFADVIELLTSIERDGSRHRAEIRDMLARSDPQAVGPSA
jgi:bacterioferritin (cytochrome b1)